MVQESEANKLHLLCTSLFGSMLIAPLCAYTSASLLYWAQTRAPPYSRCRWGVKDVDIRDILITPAMHIFTPSYTPMLIARLCAYTNASRIILWVQTRAPLYYRCRWGVSDAEIRYESFTPIVRFFAPPNTAILITRLCRLH